MRRKGSVSHGAAADSARVISCLARVMAEALQAGCERPLRQAPRSTRISRLLFSARAGGPIPVGWSCRTRLVARLLQETGAAGGNMFCPRELY